MGDNLELVFIKYTQQEKITVTHQNVNQVTVNYSDIGKSWKYDGSQSNQEKCLK